MQPLQQRIINKFQREFIKGDIITRRRLQDQLEISYTTARKLVIHLLRDKAIEGIAPDQFNHEELRYKVL